MAKIGRMALAILAGAAAWALLWNLGTFGAQSAFPSVLAPDQPIEHLGALAGLIAYSVVLSVLAGYITRSIDTMRSVVILSCIQLTFGIIAETSYWELMPVWYHLVFLALVVPMTLLGGRLAPVSG